MDSYITGWLLEPKTLSDGSMVFDVAGWTASGTARVEIHCVDRKTADEVLHVLNGTRVVGAAVDLLAARRAPRIRQAG